MEITDEDVEKMIDLGIDLSNEEEVYSYFENDYTLDIPCSCIYDVQFDYDKFFWELKMKRRCDYEKR